MILENLGNPYYLIGTAFHSIGRPYIGLQNAWPMSFLVYAMTLDDDQEILQSLELVKNASIRGLVYESINANRLHDHTSKALQ